MKLSISIVSAVSISTALVATLAATGCKKTNKDGGGSGAGGGGSIALLLPESQTARYETADKPFFEAKFKQLCPNVDIVYSNANQVAADQQQQAEAAIARGVKVMVLDPVDGDAAGTIVKSAKAKNIPVISYDRLIKGGSTPDYYVSFDNERVGKLQAQALLEKLTSGGNAQPEDHDDQRLAHRQQCHAVQERRPQRVRRQGGRSSRRTPPPTGSPRRPSS